MTQADLFQRLEEAQASRDKLLGVFKRQTGVAQSYLDLYGTEDHCNPNYQFYAGYKQALELGLAHVKAYLEEQAARPALTAQVQIQIGI